MQLRKTSAAIFGDWKTAKNPLTVSRWGSQHRELVSCEMSTRRVWYRLMYALELGWIYVLHCFEKKTNQTSLGDINLAKARLKAVKARKDEPFKEEEEKSA